MARIPSLILGNIGMFLLLMHTSWPIALGIGLVGASVIAWVYVDIEKQGGSKR